MLGRALTPAIELTGDILVRMNELFAGLRVFPERMRANLDLSGGLIMSESLMLALGRELGRQRAHDAVYEAAQEAAGSLKAQAAGVSDLPCCPCRERTRMPMSVGYYRGNWPSSGPTLFPCPTRSGRSI